MRNQSGGARQIRFFFMRNVVGNDHVIDRAQRGDQFSTSAHRQDRRWRRGDHNDQRFADFLQFGKTPRVRRRERIEIPGDDRGTGGEDLLSGIQTTISAQKEQIRREIESPTRAVADDARGNIAPELRHIQLDAVTEVAQRTDVA